MRFFSALKNKYAQITTVVLLQFVAFQNAFAQTLGFNNPASDDMSIAFINQIFGQLVQTVAGGAGGGMDAFGSSIGTFNGAILTVGGILAAYTILAGTLGTAHDGEMLGKKFSSVWIPVRYSLGTALVLPILPGGYCVMQALVMWIILQGVAIGNLAWSAYMTGATSMTAKATYPARQKIHTFVETVYKMNVCVEANALANGGTGSDAANYSVLNLGGLHKYGVQKIKRVDNIAVVGSHKWGFGDYAVLNMKPTMCGEIYEPVKPSVFTGGSTVVGGGAAPTGGIGALTGVETYYNGIDIAEVYDVHIKQTETIVKATQALAKKAVADPGSVKYEELAALSLAYANDLEAVGQRIASQANSTTTVAQAATKQGWFLAGSWFTKVIAIQNKITSVMTLIPAHKYNPSFKEHSTSEAAITNYNKGMQIFSAVKNEIESNAAAANNSNDSKVQAQVDWGGKLGEELTSAMAGIKLSEIKDDSRHPLILMNEIGGRLMGAYAAFIVGGLAVTAGVGLLKGLSFGLADLSPMVTFFTSVFMFPFAILLTTGITLSYVLPNLPFLIWIGIIVGWLIMVVEAVLAAPLWAIMHLHPNGDDLTGRGGNGYMLVLGLLLRPVLIIFGFIAAIVLTSLLGQLVNKVFFDVFTSSNLEGEIGFFALIAGTSIYAGIMYMVITKGLTLMHVLPDQLMRWIGGGQEQLGQYAGGFSGEGMAKTAAITGAAGGYLAKEVGQGVGQGISGMHQLQQRQQTLAEAKGNKTAQLAATERDIVGANATANQASPGLGDAHAAIDSNFAEDYKQANAASMTKEDKADRESYDRKAIQQAQFDHGTQSKKAQISSTANILGKDSVAAMKFNETFANEYKGGADFDTAYQTALNKGLDSAYGAGTFDGISKLTNNDLKGSDFAGAVQQVSNKFDKIVKEAGLEPDEARGKISEMFSHANSLVEDSAQSDTSSMTFNQALSKASKKINNDLDL